MARSPKFTKFPLRQIQRPRAQGFPYQGPVCQEIYFKIQAYLFEENLQDEVELYEFGFAKSQIHFQESRCCMYFGGRREINIWERKLFKHQWHIVEVGDEIHIANIAQGNWTWLISILNQNIEESRLEKICKTITDLLQDYKISSTQNAIACFVGPELNSQIQEIVESKWRIGVNSNSMGIRLIPLDESSFHKKLNQREDSGIVSSPVFPGTIQWTLSGPIILGPHCQTHGGYQRVGFVEAEELQRLCQMKPGQVVSLAFFNPLISLE